MVFTRSALKISGALCILLGWNVWLYRCGPHAKPRTVTCNTTSITSQLHWVNGQMQIALRFSRFVCARAWLCKTDSRLSEDQGSQNIALSAINNAFSVHSNHVQDSCELGMYHWINSLYSCVLTATVQHSLQDSGSSGPRLLGSLVLGSWIQCL